MNFKRIPLKVEINVSKLVTFHYTELTKNYIFEGEKHDFWEFLYLDKGEIQIVTDHLTLNMKQGDLIFYSPNEFHSLKANNKIASNVLVISFECASPIMEFFKSKYFHLGDFERSLLSNILKEKMNAYDQPVQMPLKLMKKRNQIFGSEQLIKVQLEMLLINLVRKGNAVEYNTKLSSSAKERSEGDISAQIKSYLMEHLCERISVSEISRHFHIGRTKITTIFKKETGHTIIEYYNKLKIEQAKILIREQNYNYSEIAELLGYSSVHYFSRQFKRDTNMNPSEYDKSLKARVLDSSTA